MALKLRAKRTITSGKGVEYDLPDGEYYIKTSKERSDLCNEIYQVADAIRSKPCVLVTESNGSSFRLKKVPGDS